MEYQVPQFIEVEDKIVGPLTLRQFIYIAGGIGLGVICWIYLPLWLAFPLIALVAGGAAGLAFYKINGKPLIQVLEAGFNYFTGAKLFLWQHEDAQITAQVIKDKTQVAESPTPKLSRGKLTELAWSLDVKTPGAGDGSLEA